MRRREPLKGLDRAVLAAVAAGFIGFGVSFAAMFAKISSSPEIFEPYPPFGASFGWLRVAVLGVYGALWLALAVRTLRSISADGVTGALVLCGFAAFVMFVTGLGAGYGLECANALLDASPQVREPVLVRHLRREHAGRRNHESSAAIATISPVDLPTRQFDLNWSSCNVDDRSVPVSPFGAVRVGRGAFGVPWVDLPVECRQLAIDDRPLVRGLVLGRAPAVIVMLWPREDLGVDSAARTKRREKLYELLDRVGQGFPLLDAETVVNAAHEVLSADGAAAFEKTWAPVFDPDSTAKIDDIARAAAQIVDADGKHLTFGRRLSIWRRAVDGAAPGLPMVVIENGFGVGPASLVSLPCPGCTIVSAEEVDDGVLRLFTHTSPFMQLGWEGEQIFLADRAGKLAFKAGLSDTGRAPALARFRPVRCDRRARSSITRPR